VTTDNQVASDECEVTMKFLPMRCIIDQRAIAFIRAFFGSDGEETKSNDPGWMAGLHLLPPPKFRVFRVKPWKLKVDYCPKKLDIAALRGGSFVELINLSPIDGMVITLRQVNVENVCGGGEVLGGLTRSWVQEICATQLHKFLTNARPFEPFANVSSGVADLVVLPYEALRNGEEVRRAIRSGITSLAGIVAFEALTTTSRLTQYAAKKMANAVGGTAPQPSNITASSLPSRPLETPKGVGDVAGHVMESLARGVQVANYKVIVVPYREYSKRGATGAAKSVLKGIPVLVVAPLSGATEAISYTLLGARNALRPDIRKEEEAYLRGLHYEM
jgi:autophagy-related protein 2